jgi:hypothetical protein
MDKYVLRDINQNFIVSSGLVDHDTSLYKFVGFNSTKIKPFNPMFLMLMN